MSRVVSGLLWARQVPRPEFIPRSRPKGAKAKGLRFERLVAKALPGAKHALWFEYGDSHGKGWCSTDLVLEFPNRVVVIEVKLTDTPVAIGQLAGLYLPVLAKAFAKPTYGVIVAKHLTTGTEPTRVVDNLAAALRLCTKTIPVLHWLGRGRL